MTREFEASLRKGLEELGYVRAVARTAEPGPSGALSDDEARALDQALLSPTGIQYSKIEFCVTRGRTNPQGE